MKETAICIVDDGRRIVREGRAASEPEAPKHGLQRPRPPEIHFYFVVSALAAPGFGFAGALGTIPVGARVFFLSALGFLASRLLLF